MIFQNNISDCLAIRLFSSLICTQKLSRARRGQFAVGWARWRGQAGLTAAGNHCDFVPDKNSLFHTRKLSATLQLCDADEYGGGDLLLDMSVYEKDVNDNSEFNRMIRSKGSIVVFDSRMPHEVIPITHGTRYSLVKWVHGDTPLK